MNTYPPPPRRGVAWLAFALCLAAAAGGLLLSGADAERYWVADAYGAYAGFGVAAALFVIVCGHLARLLRRSGDRD